MPTEKTQNTQDPNSVYILHKFDINSSKLVNSVFDGTTGFNHWKRAINDNLLVSQKQIEFC